MNLPTIITKLTLTLSLTSIFFLNPPAAIRQTIDGAQVNATQTGAAATTLTLDGLRARVTVRRDERGVPHIEAANEEDLYIAQGFIMASDRLWQMDLLRRSARGELSEIFGKAALEEDKRRRTLGFARVAEASAALKTSPRTRAVLEAYARGVNAFINSRTPETLPVEFRVLRYSPRPWTIADSLVVGKNFAEALSTTWRLDLMNAMFAHLPADKKSALFPRTSPHDVLVVGTDQVQKKSARRAAAAQLNESTSSTVKLDRTPETMRALADIEATSARTRARTGLYMEHAAASNNWVVNGTRTTTGKPLLADDPHLQPTAPSIWYLAHLSAPGVNVAGVTSPGAPGIIIGHNERIAWGVTNLGPDVQDIYREKFDPANPRRYQTPAGWRDAEVRVEEIKVRQSLTSTSVDTVTHEVTVTRHGPVVFEKDGARYALRWAALDPQGVEFEGFERLNRARNWNEFRDALKSYRGPTQNFVYADVDGNIGYYGAGQIPIRKSGDGSVPYDGSTDAGEWTAMIPFDQLPHVYNPPSGMIVTANSRVVGQSYPHHLTHIWASPDRSRRIYEMLMAKPKLTVEDFRVIQGDVHSQSAMMFAREIVEVAREAAPSSTGGGGDNGWSEAIKLFESWDGQIVPESRAALLIATVRGIFAGKILTAALGAEGAKAYAWPNRSTLIDRLIVERPRDWLPTDYKDYAGLLRDCVTEARASFVKQYGADEAQWTWGRSTQVRFAHPLAGALVVGKQFAVQPFPQRGSSRDFPTVNVGAGVSMRFIADLSNWDDTQHGITLGQSGDPTSRHWTDQLADWRAITPRTLPFTPQAVKAAAKETLILSPTSK